MMTTPASISSDAPPAYETEHAPPVISFVTIPGSAIPDRLPISELDESSGFIHLSTAGQIAGTLGHFFGGEDRVCVLKVRYSGDGGVEGNVRWEEPEREVCGTRDGEGRFPDSQRCRRCGGCGCGIVVQVIVSGFRHHHVIARCTSGDSWLERRLSNGRRGRRSFRPRLNKMFQPRPMRMLARSRRSLSIVRATRPTL